MRGGDGEWSYVQCDVRADWYAARVLRDAIGVDSVL
jgi:hypothetical protein